MPLVLPGTAIVLTLSRNLFEGLDGAHVRPRGPGTHRDAEGHARKIHDRAGGDPVRVDQLGETFPGHDDDVGSHAARQLSGDRVRPASLRRTRSRGDLDPAGPLEFRQQLIVCAGESSGHQNAHTQWARHLGSPLDAF